MDGLLDPSAHGHARHADALDIASGDIDAEKIGLGQLASEEGVDDGIGHTGGLRHVGVLVAVGEGEADARDTHHGGLAGGTERPGIVDADGGVAAVVDSREDGGGTTGDETVEAELGAIDGRAFDGVAGGLAEACALADTEFVHDREGVALSGIASIGRDDDNIGVAESDIGQDLDSWRGDAVVIGYHEKRLLGVGIYHFLGEIRGFV